MKNGRNKLIVLGLVAYSLLCLGTSGVFFAGQMGFFSIGKGALETLVPVPVSEGASIGVSIFTAFVSLFVGSIFAVFETLGLAFVGVAIAWAISKIKPKNKKA